jgi:iron complex outermembrane receptor protein
VAGGNYFKDKFNFRAFFSVGLTALIPQFDAGTGSFIRADGAVNLDTRALSDYQLQYTNQDRTEYAVFWDGTYDLTEQWHLTAGVRYSKDKKAFIRAVDGGGLCNQYTEAQDIKTVDGVCRDTRSQNISRAGITPRQYDGRSIPLPPSSFGTYLDTENSWSKSTFRLVLDYKPMDGQMVYLSYATGFLSGGFSETCATVSRCAYKPETNTNVELGYKADLLDNTLRFNASVYQTKYDSLQRAVTASYQSADGTGQQETVTVNTGSSKATGVDLEATWVASEALRVGGSVNWLKHDYTSGILPNLRGDSGTAISLLPFDVPFSPKLKYGVNASYDVNMATGSRLVFAGDVNYQSVSETDVFNGTNTQQQKRTLVNVSATWHDAKDRYSLTGYVANVTDETYRIAALPVAGLWNFTNYGAPRSFGLTLNVKFGE